MNSSSAIPVAVVGASGYAGEDLVRLLLRHPTADLVAVTSRQYSGQTVAQVFPRFAHLGNAAKLRFVDPQAAQISAQAQLVFLALPHGVAAEFAAPLFAAGCKLIDLSADFRLKKTETYKEFYGHEHPAPELIEEAVYGLPEMYRDEIRQARFVACPGCYPTSILLPLLPLIRAGLIDTHQIVINSLSGVTGAGRKAEVDYLFAECNESIRPYGVPKHRHLSEIEQELSRAAGETVIVQFTPHLIPVNRGILTTICVRPKGTTTTDSDRQKLVDAIANCYAAAYGNEPFVRVLEGKALPDTKNVTGTNFLDLAWRLDPRTGALLLFSAEDNIVKGTSGQAVQCFNIMHGLPETAGLI